MRVVVIQRWSVDECVCHSEMRVVVIQTGPVDERGEGLSFRDDLLMRVVIIQRWSLMRVVVIQRWSVDEVGCH